MNVTEMDANQLRDFLGEPVEELPERKAICVALLAHDDKLHLDTFLSILTAVPAIAAKDWGFSILQRSGDSMVARGRSFLASQFLTRPDIAHCTDLVYIDTDLSFSPEMFVRLCSHNVDVVGGAYPYKDESGNFPCQWSSDGVREENGLWKMKAVTPGFFRITRRALARIAREMPWLEFKDRGNKGEERSYMFFNNEHRYTGIYDEGYILCEKWRTCGGTVHCDPDLNLTHIGLKKYNCGTLRQWVDNKAFQYEELSKKYPMLPSNTIMSAVMNQKTEELETEARNANSNHPDARASGITSLNRMLHSIKYNAGRYHAPRGGGRRRSPDLGMLIPATERSSASNLYRTA